MPGSGGTSPSWRRSPSSRPTRSRSPLPARARLPRRRRSRAAAFRIGTPWLVATVLLLATALTRGDAIPNSCTSSSDAAARLFPSSSDSPWSGRAAPGMLAWWLQPVYGDLTRLGGTLSARMAGTNPERIRSRFPPSFGEWTQPVDILVVGDSFANLRPAQQWQNHLAANDRLARAYARRPSGRCGRLARVHQFVEHPPSGGDLERGRAQPGRRPREGGGRCRTTGLPPWRCRPPMAVVAMRASGLAYARASFDVNPGSRAPGSSPRPCVVSSRLRRKYGPRRLALGRTCLPRAHPPACWYADDFGKAGGATEHLRRIPLRLRTRDALSGRWPDGVRVRAGAGQVERVSSWARDPARLPPERLWGSSTDLAVPDVRLDLAVRRRGERGDGRHMPDDYALEHGGHTVAAQAIMERPSRLPA